jgi:heme exporter protein A
MPIGLEATDLACARGGRLVFSGLSFRIESGDALAVTGPNGSGKTSLLRLFAGLLRPHSGSFRLLGRSEEEPSIHYLGHGDALKPPLTLRETLRFWSAVYRQQGRAPLDRELDEVASTVGLGHALDLRTGVLSAGQRRRAGLARLILSPRSLWLLDEPTSSLDREGEVLLGALMRNHLTAGGMIVAATHQDLPIESSASIHLGEAT